MSTWYWLLHQSLDIAQNPEEICQSSGFLVKSSINKNRHNSGTKNDSVSSWPPENIGKPIRFFDFFRKGVQKGKLARYCSK